MELMTSILNIAMIVLLVRAVFSVIAGLMLSNKVRKAKENQAEISDNLNEQNKELQDHIQSLMVQDDYCGKMISSEKAFIIRIDNKPHHFCSWDCREKFLSESA